LTAVRAAAALCSAHTVGDMLASQELDFIPAAPVSAGDYIFDVALAREGGSAGAVSLVAQLLSFETVGDTARACAR
jgi:RNA 3'-terminal phosphate cyclase (ATP)